MTVLAFDAVCAGYADERVFSDVTFDVRPGRFVGLVGPNGVGKTTLLRVVTGAAKLIAGSVALDGRNAGTLPPREVARLVAVMPQTPSAAFAFTAEEYVEMGRNPWLPRLGSLTAEDRAVVHAALALTDTEALAGMRVDRLSGGDLQRLALAQALAQTTRVLLLDEPTSHLDLNHRLQVLDLVRRRADEGTAVLGVFHDLEMAARYADEVVVLHDGGVHAYGPPEETLTATVLRDVFGVAAVVTTDPVTGSVAITAVLRRASVSCRRGCRVMLVCGSGSGGALMRRLVLDGYDVFAGALNRGDTDESVADVLGVSRVALEPFTALSDAEERRVRAEAEACDAVVVCPTPFGRGNVGVLRAAIGARRPMMLVGSMAGRDYAGGEATELVARAAEAGARRVTDWREAADALEEVLEDASRGDRRRA